MYISRLFDTQVKRLLWLLFLAGILLVVGMLSPIMTIRKMVFFRNEFSLIGGLVDMLRGGEIFLFIVISAFSVVLPIFKIALLFYLLRNLDTHTTRQRRWLRWFHDYGKWSMLDVFVVAVLLTSVKLGSLVTVQVHYGLYVFAAGIIGIMYVTMRVTKLSNDVAR